ncbi:MAG: hypothetical protein EXR74_00780 [Bdellovibrionales bacterium]|nr:hypothetical protein [Bdellovibrionales bacterium]
MIHPTQLMAPAPEFSYVFRELLGCLFNEPFSLNNNFKDLSFEDVGLVLEESFGGTENLSESYESCKSTYCLMLIELDLNGYSDLPKILRENPINDIAHLAIWPSVNKSPLPLDLPIGPPLELKMNAPLSLISEVPLEEIIAEQMMISTDIFEAAPTFELLPATPDNLNEISDDIESAIKSVIIANSDLDNRPTPSSHLTSEINPTEKFSGLDSEVIPILQELNPVTAFKTSTETPIDSDYMTTLGQDYFKLADLFKLNLNTNSIPISPSTSERAAIQFLVVACELEIFKTLRENLIALWPEREIKIQGLLKVDTFKFNDEISQVIQNHQNRFADWLYDAKFPELAALHCLRYLVLTPTIDELHPSVFELATFIYFWSALADPNTESLCHQSEGPQLSQDQMIEIAFRLFRLDRIKANANNFNYELSNQHFQQTQEDTTRILELLNENSMVTLEREVA